MHNFYFSIFTKITLLTILDITYDTDLSIFFFDENVELYV